MGKIVKNEEPPAKIGKVGMYDNVIKLLIMKFEESLMQFGNSEELVFVNEGRTDVHHESQSLRT